MLKKTLASAIILLFIFSSVTPMVVGFDNPPNEPVAGPMDSPWPMKSHDVFHTGRSSYSTENNNGAELWKYKTTGRMDGGIAIDNEGVLYFGDLPFFYAVYPNGTLKWKQRLSSGVVSTPALAEDGTIYIGSFGNDFYAFNPDGSVKWTFDALNSIASSPSIAEDGTIYFGTMGSPVDGRRLYALNPDGTLKWYYQTRNKVTSSPAIGEDGVIYVGSMDKHLYAINPNGTLKWRYKTGDEIHSHPSIGSDGTIYFGSNDYYLYALHPNGTLHWKYKINGPLYSNVAIGKDGTIYCPDHSMYAFTPDGTLKWRFDFGNDLGVSRSAPAIGNEGTIYVGLTKQGSSGGYIISINPDGTERWRRKISNYQAGSSPAIGTDGTVYIGSTINDYPNGWFGYLYAFGEGNIEPDKPTINGPQNGKKGEEYTYTISTYDPDNDKISYYIDWGDGSNTGWQGLYISGTEISLTHKWMFQGTYPIKAKAKDEHGKESDWATLEVSMPKNKIINPFERFLENHPYMFPLLRQLLNLQ